MSGGLRDWLALALILVALGLIAYGFTRRTYRLATMAVIAAGVAGVTGYGMHAGGRPANYLAALQAGGNLLATQMFGAVMPARLRGVIVPGLAGWLALLVAVGGLLVAFDTLATRRQAPAVQVGEVPAPAPGAGADGQPPTGLALRRLITEELKFRLPAVEVRMPGSMPGGSTVQSLATVVADTGVSGSKVAAAIMQGVHALEARPRLYQVGTFVERCHPDGSPDPEGPYALVTVDLRDARTGQTIVTRVLPPCPPGDAAERAAGLVARQVFRGDASTPAWAAGSLDGEDLAAYLLSRELRPAGQTYRDLWECRRRQQDTLAGAGGAGSSPGLVQYELASLYELAGRPLEALALHLANRLHHPRFLRARYRLAVALSMLADPVTFGHWAHAGQPAEGGEETWAPAGLRADVVRQLGWAGMLRLPAADLRRLGLVRPGRLARLSPRRRRAAAGAGQRAVAAALEPPAGTPLDRELARRVLLVLARREFAACRRRMRALALLWCALAHRSERAVSLAALRTPPRWWLHPRRRLWAVMMAQDLVAIRLCGLERPAEAAGELAAAQARARRRLGLAGAGGLGLRGGRAWRYGRVPWQAVYNAACLFAAPEPAAAGPPGSADERSADERSADERSADERSADERSADASAREAVQLLRLAMSDPACELDRPAEWLSADPDLRRLRGNAEFREFIREQASRDFAPAAGNDVAPQWLRGLLPALPGGQVAHPGRPGPHSPVPGQRLAQDGVAGLAVQPGQPGPVPAPGPPGRAGGHRPSRGGWFRYPGRPRQP